ncbi:cyanophycin synthetase [Herminiimonas sp. NPDC097707]|uniref:cyanophycin synthetase n=1 Tax=Herminiimonas sp. NPDC097707 TaxID=3364007 RepID=UPI00383B7432
MNNKTIEIIDVLSLRGPNIWTYRPVLEAWVDIGDLEDSPSNTIPGFYERLTAWLPSLVEHHCGVGVHGGFLMRLREGTWPGHIMEHVMIELQNLAGMQSGFGKARETGKRGVYKVVVRARHEEVSRAALVAARDLVMAAIEDKPYDVQSTVDHLRNILESVALGPSTGCIVEAATDRRIPSMRLNDGNLVQLGYGIKQRRIWTAETDQTSAIAETISSDKELTKTLLQSCGVPVPEGRIVNSAADAWEAAESIGLPVVIKPLDGNHGRGVSTNLNTAADIEAAFLLAEQESSDVIVERFILGNEHRLLIVGGKLVAAARGEEATVVADGKSSISELINSQLNCDPRRGSSEDCPLNLILIDEADDPRVVLLELARQGYTTESIPAAGKKILIQRNGNVAFDVTDQVHPTVAAAASLAARIVGLDIAGVDLVVEDISKPLAEQGGAIVEVNAGPGLLMHLKPADGPARPVGRAIVDHLFAEDESGRIPIIGVTGSHGTTVVSRLIAWFLHLQGAYVGLACKDGLFLRQRPVLKKASDNWDAGRQVLMNRMVEAAVFESSSKAILSEGLAYDWCQVGVVTNIDPADTLPEFYIDDAEQMSRVLRTQIDVVLSTGVAVLNAADERVAELASLCDGSVIFFAASPAEAVIAAHLANGQRAVFMRDGNIVLATGKEEILIDNATPHAALTMENSLAAVAAAWALGIGPELIRAGIETFEATDAAIAA